jgi:hypothetical protein
MSNPTTPSPQTQPASSDKLATIRTYILVALIFSIIIMVVWLLAGIGAILSYLAIAALGGIYYTGFYIGGLIEGIILLIFIVPAVLVFFRIWKMYKAVNAGDIATLKATSNILWAIIALIFAGVIPGIMLILADGPIKQL